MELIQKWNGWMNRNMPGRERSYTAVQHAGYASLTLGAIVIVASAVIAILR